MLVDFSHEIWEKWEAVFFGHDLPIFSKALFSFGFTMTCQIQPQRALPATFVSVFDALRRAKEAAGVVFTRDIHGVFTGFQWDLPGVKGISSEIPSVDVLFWLVD